MRGFPNSLSLTVGLWLWVWCFNYSISVTFWSLRDRNVLLKNITDSVSQRVISRWLFLAVSWPHFLSLSLSVFSSQAEGDVKEEILQPPEPHPVPPILTPSPPSAFPTVTNVRQDNDRYHPRPVIHVMATTQAQVSNINLLSRTPLKYFFSHYLWTKSENIVWKCFVWG